MILENHLFDSLLEPVFIVNENLQILYCNETAAVISQLSQRKLMRSQMKITDVFKLSEPIEGFEKLAQVTDPTPYKEVHFQTTEGGEGKAQITVQRLGQDSQWIVFIRDVTLEERLQKKYRAELDAKEDVIEKLKKAQVELENYSKNLEKMVEDRTSEIRELNQKLKALLDSLNQGFLIFDSSGSCWEVTSKACQKVLETDPAGQKIWDVLKLPEAKHDGFRKWMITLFGELLPFEDMAALGPKEFPHSQGNRINLEYYPIRNSKNEISGVVLVSTDITELVQAQMIAEKEKANSQFILKVIKQKKSFLGFYEEIQRQSEELMQAVQAAPAFWNHELIFRLLHTIKGGASTYSIKPITDTAHRMENQILQLQNEPDEFSREAWNSDLSLLNLEFQNLKSDVEVLLGSHHHQQSLDQIELPRETLSQVLSLLESWSKTREFSLELQAQYLTESVQETFSSYQFVLQSTADQLGKKVEELKFLNPDMRWTPKPYSAFLSTLVHVFRNAVDHGLESPQERLTLGKPEKGCIQMELKKSAKGFALTIQDDGKGINPFIIKQKMIEKGLPVEGLTESEILSSIFHPQFSTRNEVTEISGRGVGLDAVKNEIDKIGGTVQVSSVPGEGTTFCFCFPEIKSQTENRPALKAA